MQNNKEIIFCPVCGYKLGFDFMSSQEICPSCGTQFGYDDAGGFSTNDNGEKLKEIHRSLRKKWTDAGMKWSSENNPLMPRPKGWNPEEQLKNIPEEFK